METDPHEVPSGLPDDAPEAPPLGVPLEDEPHKEADDDDVSLPGLPADDDPPMTG